jgi:hypothetical protein
VRHHARSRAFGHSETPTFAEEMIERLQAASRDALNNGIARFRDHPVWTEGGWKTYLDSTGAVRSRVRYVEGNPMKEGLPRQVWPFVVTYDGWPHDVDRRLNRKR